METIYIKSEPKCEDENCDQLNIKEKVNVERSSQVQYFNMKTQKFDFFFKKV